MRIVSPCTGVMIAFFWNRLMLTFGLRNGMLTFMIATCLVGVSAVRGADEQAYLATMTGAEVERNERRDALRSLAEERGVTEVALLIEVLGELEESDDAVAAEVIEDLGRLMIARRASELREAQPAIEQWADEAAAGVFRQWAYVAWVAADRGFDGVWAHASQSLSRLEDALLAVPLVSNRRLRGAAHERVIPLLDGPAEGLAEAGRNGNEGDPEAVREAAIRAVVTTGQQEEETFGVLASLFATEVELRPAVIEALETLPEAARSAEAAAVIVEAVIEHLKGLSESDRSADAALRMQRFAHGLAQQLPDEQGAALQEELRRLGVVIVVIKPINHQLLFDKVSFVVEAGRPVELVFENTDNMPHNLLITEPGAMERVSLAAEAMAGEPDAFARGFVPEMEEVLWATELLMLNERETLRFIAPEAGEYPYVCTFPGHWRRMYGVMIVVDDLEAWHANPTEPTDPLTGETLERQPILDDPSEMLEDVDVEAPEHEH